VWYLSAFDFSAIQLVLLRVGGTKCSKIEEVNRTPPANGLHCFVVSFFIADLALKHFIDSFQLLFGRFLRLVQTDFLLGFFR
jgi:hypothetical protein